MFKGASELHILEDSELVKSMSRELESFNRRRVERDQEDIFVVGLKVFGQQKIDLKVAGLVK